MVLRHVALLVLLVVLAVLPRTLAPGTFLTIDEAYHWFERAQLFRQAVQTGDYAATNLIGHPGVTTMWLGAAGLQAHDTLAEVGIIDADAPDLQRSFYRIPVGITTALCIGLAYPMLRRLLGNPTAGLAALLWATEPFLVAHSKVLHVDALLTSFMLLALLAALLAFRLDASPQELATRRRSPIRWPWLVASAVAGGLALLTKSPAVVLLPMGALVALLGLLRATAGTASGRWWRVARGWLLACGLWAGIAALVWVLLWPAAWVDLSGAINRVFMQVRYEGTTPHGWGNFFLGKAVDDPGPLFYPLAILFRLTPWTCIGLLAGVVALFWRGRAPQARLPIALLLVFVLLFVVVLSLSPKKFDRYVLPIFPALAIVAAAGGVWMWQWLRPLLSARPRCACAMPALLAAGGVGLLAGNLLWYHPYELAYYNPLLGGGPAAVRVLPVGWGEGLGQAGRYISARTNGCDYPVATYYQPALEPFLCSPVVPLPDVALPGRVDYAVLYIDQIQRRNAWEATTRLQSSPPVHTVRIHGIDYAFVYQLPRPLENATNATFGERIDLHSYEIDTAAVRSSGTLTLTTQWQAHRPPNRDYMLFVHLLDEQGQRISQIDVPPGGPRAPTSTWQPGHYVTWFHPIPVPASSPPGTYWIALGLYDPQTSTRLPLAAPPHPDAPDAGANALLLQKGHLP